MVDTLRHLFLTVSSIDSMIVGENQILSQVKNSYEYSCEQKLCGKVLGITFQKAISIGKRVRTETDISRGKVSISSAAVDLANQNNALEGKKVLIIGSGNMASLVADHLGSFNIGELVVVGRTPENLERFCRCHSSRYILFDKLDFELKNSDVIFSATACPRILITRERIQNTVKNRTNTLTVVDIAMPEDVDSTVGEFENVQYFCIDDLKEISEGNRELRYDEAQKAEEIINEELKQFIKGLQNIHISNLLVHLNTYTEDIRARELERSLKMLGETEPKVALILESLTKSLMKKMMHNFVTGLREYSGDEDDVKIFVDMFMGNKLKMGGNGVNGAMNGHPQGHNHTDGAPHGHQHTDGAPHGHQHTDGAPHGHQHTDGAPHGHHHTGGHPHPHAQGHPHTQGHPHAAPEEEPETQDHPHASKKKDMVVTDVSHGTNEKA
jgi:glutamyl-tRNA reductase